MISVLFVCIVASTVSATPLAVTSNNPGSEVTCDKVKTKEELKLMLGEGTCVDIRSYLGNAFWVFETVNFILWGTEGESSRIIWTVCYNYQYYWSNNYSPRTDSGLHEWNITLWSHDWLQRKRNLHLPRPNRHYARSVCLFFFVCLMVCLFVDLMVCLFVC